MADEAAARRVHGDGRTTWLVRFIFLAPQAPYLGPLFADPGQLSEPNQSEAEAEAAEPVDGSVWPGASRSAEEVSKVLEAQSAHTVWPGAGFPEKKLSQQGGGVGE